MNENITHPQFEYLEGYWGVIDISGLVLWMTKSHYYFEIGEVNIGEVVHLFFRYVYYTTHSTINHIN